MSIIREGSEWMARALAEAAKHETHERIGGEGRWELDMAYLTGVRDAMRVLAGDIDPRETGPLFRAVYERHLNRI